MIKITLSFLSVLMLVSCGQRQTNPWLDSVADSIGYSVVKLNGFAGDLHIVVVDSAWNKLVESRTHSSDLGQTCDFPDPYAGELLFPFLLASVDSIDTGAYLPVGYNVFGGIPVVDNRAWGQDSLPLLQAMTQGSKVAAVEFAYRHYNHRRDDLRHHLAHFLPGQPIPEDLSFVKLCSGDFPVAPETLLEGYRMLVLTRPDIVGDSSGMATISSIENVLTGLYLGHNGPTCILIVVHGSATHTVSLMETIASNIFSNH